MSSHSSKLRLGLGKRIGEYNCQISLKYATCFTQVQQPREKTFTQKEKVMNETRKRNHVVPRFYLEKWATPDQRICIYRILVSHREVPKWGKKYLSGAEVQKYFYTYLRGGKVTDAMEVFFAENFESPAALVLEKVDANKPISRSDWATLIDFLAATDARTVVRLKEHLSRMQTTGPRLVTDSMNKVKEKVESGRLTAKKVNDDDSEKAKRVPSPLKIKVDNDMESRKGTMTTNFLAGRVSWLYSMEIVLTEVKQILHEHKWTIIKPARGYTWFTSDNPVLKINSCGPDGYDLGGGWGGGNGQILFPIGPKHAMYTRFGHRPPPRYSRLSVEKTNQVREIIAANAYRAIFSFKNEDDVEQLRPREENEEKFNREREEMRLWHSVNSEMELKYFDSDDD